MRLKYNKTTRGKCFYIIRSVYKNGKNTSETYEKLGYPEDIREKYQCEDADQWMKEHLEELNELEKAEKNTTVLIPYNAAALIPKGTAQAFNVGYLFLQKIYYELRLDLTAAHISRMHSFHYDMNAVLSRLIYGRVLFPSSKLATVRQSASLLEPPGFDYQHVERALSVIASEFDTIQSELYKTSSSVIQRKTGVLYYDCTNFYFEIEEEDEETNAEADEKELASRKYGKSKQHQPSPLVQMGLFMDYSGIPLAICINRGNKNEQQTLIPLEKKILQDFELSRFVVCTDAGLSSEANRKFNNFGERSFVTTVSVKGMDAELTKWCLEPSGWHLEGSEQEYDISHLEDTPEEKTENYNKVFYKQRYVEGYDEERDIEFNQTLIVTFSIKYRDYLARKREGQIQRAQKAISENSSSLKKKNQQDFRRFIKQDFPDEKAEEDGNAGQPDGSSKKGRKKKKKDPTYSIDEEAIAAEKKYDGFYAVETNLDSDVKEILEINRGRWEIEESFRIMKDEFHSRPVYVSRSDRIKAHFMTCFIALLIYRILEKKLDNKYTHDQIISTLRSMWVTKVQDIGYQPSYTRTDLTDDLHEIFGFRTDYELTRQKAMQGIIRKTKQR